MAARSETPGQLLTIEYLGYHTENRAVDVIEDRLRYLALRHKELVPQRQNLNVAPGAARQQQPDTS